MELGLVNLEFSKAESGEPLKEASGLFFQIKTNGNNELISLNSYAAGLQNLIRNKSYTDNLTNNFVHLINSKSDKAISDEENWDKIVTTDKEGEVIEALNIIEPKIIRLAFAQTDGTSRNPIVRLKGNETPPIFTKHGRWY